MPLEIIVVDDGDGTGLEVLPKFNGADIKLCGFSSHKQGAVAARNLGIVEAQGVLIAFLERLMPARWIYVALPVLLAVAFQFVARADGAAGGIVGFAVVGLACSAFLPLSMSGALIAFYQVGYGVAAFGVGPLRRLASLEYSSLFSGGSVVAAALAVAAFMLSKSGRSSIERPSHSSGAT